MVMVTSFMKYKNKKIRKRHLHEYDYILQKLALIDNMQLPRILIHYASVGKEHHQVHEVDEHQNPHTDPNRIIRTTVFPKHLFKLFIIKIKLLRFVGRMDHLGRLSRHLNLNPIFEVCVAHQTDDYHVDQCYRHRYFNYKRLANIDTIGDLPVSTPYVEIGTAGSDYGILDNRLNMIPHIILQIFRPRPIRILLWVTLIYCINLRDIFLKLHLPPSGMSLHIYFTHFERILIQIIFIIKTIFEFINGMFVFDILPKITISYFWSKIKIQY